jgi:hypothetical protein
MAALYLPSGLQLFGFTHGGLDRALSSAYLFSILARPMRHCSSSWVIFAETCAARLPTDEPAQKVRLRDRSEIIAPR